LQLQQKLRGETVGQLAGGFRSKAGGLLLVGKTLWRSATLRLTEYFSSGDGRFAVVLDPFSLR